MTAAVSRRGRPGGSTGDELLDIARQVFLGHGFAGSTMDEVAARARISKQTLYRQHPSKDALFTAVVRNWVDRGTDAMRPHTDALLEAADLPDALLRFARTLQAGVLSGPVLGMRRLVAAEAERFPDVAADYVERSWDRNQRLLADALRELAARGQLVVDDPDVAAEHLTWLVLAAPLNRLTLQAGTHAPDEDSLRETAQQAVTTFLTRFGA